jgi:hypothetical protein
MECLKGAPGGEGHMCADRQAYICNVMHGGFAVHCTNKRPAVYRERVTPTSGVLSESGDPPVTAPQTPRSHSVRSTNTAAPKSTTYTTTNITNAKALFVLMNFLSFFSDGADPLLPSRSLPPACAPSESAPARNSPLTRPVADNLTVALSSIYDSLTYNLLR